MLIKSATKTHHVMARSHSTGHMPIAGPSTPPTPAPRRSSLPSETAVAHEQLPIPELTLTVSNFEAEEEQDMPVEAEEEPAPVEEAPVETKELSPRAIRAARRRSGSFEPPVAEEVAAPVELELEVRVQVKEEPLALEAHEEEVEAVEYDSSNDSSDSDTSLYTDRIIPLAGEPPLTPRPMLKPRKSALKTPPPPGSDTPESTHPAEATRSLKRKVSWHETNFYREIPHREDLPEVKRARMEEELAAAERAAALATPPVTRRTSLIFVHVRPTTRAGLVLIAVSMRAQENPGQEATRAVSPIPSTTPKRTPTTPRTPHTASRAQGGAPAASVQRAFESTAAPSITTGTPRKTPLRKPGRSVSPVKRTVELPNFVPTDLEACTVRRTYHFKTR